MANVTVNFSQWNTVRGTIRAAKNRAVKDVTFDLLDKSVNRAPINKDLQAESRGNLRNSGEASFQTELDRFIGIVSFGGSLAIDYALIQHERTDFHHQDGEAKYLERPLNENAQRYISRIRDEIRGVIG